jgi:hypothetical protein
MKIYHVQFTYDGGLNPQERTYKAGSPATAQERCQREFPGAKVIEIWTEARLASGTSLGCLTYQPVSTARVEPLPMVKPEETTFAFFSECLGRRPRN